MGTVDCIRLIGDLDKRINRLGDEAETSKLIEKNEKKYLIWKRKSSYKVD